MALERPGASLPRDLAAIEGIAARGFRDIISATLYRKSFRTIYQTGRESRKMILEQCIFVFSSGS